MPTDAYDDWQRMNDRPQVGSDYLGPEMEVVAGPEEVTSAAIARPAPDDAVSAESGAPEGKRGRVRRATDATIARARALAADPMTRQRLIDGARIMASAARAGVEADQLRQPHDTGSRRIAKFIGAAAAAALSQVETRRQDATEEFSSDVEFH